jgi:hypothetical protein
MAVRIVTVDAFTAVPFAGNPAAVCILSEARPDDWMRHVAREMNLSETAFLTPEADGYRLRWLTPSVEVDLCGHATLASAHVLWEEGHLPAGTQARFYSRGGLLLANRRGEWIELDFPATTALAAEPPPELIAALGVKAKAVARSQFDYLVEVASEAEVRAANPDSGARRDRDRAGHDRRFRFRLAVFRAGLGGRRRPGHRLGSLCAGPLLGGTNGQTGIHGVPGVGAGRGRAGAGGRRSRPAGRPGGNGAAGRDGGRWDRRSICVVCQAAEP